MSENMFGWDMDADGILTLTMDDPNAPVNTMNDTFQTDLTSTIVAVKKAIDAGEYPARTVMLPLATNPRAKMSGLRRGFVKIFCRPATGVVIGGVVVAPTASELILPIALAVQNKLTVGDLAQTLSVYPSLSGSITEAARQLVRHDDLD